MENTTQTNVKQAALKNGAIWGAISIVIFLVSWYVLRSSMGSGWYGFLTIAIGILLAVYFCKDLREKAGGYWSFGQALWPIFGMFILSAAMSYFFAIGFGKYIDTEYPQVMREMVAEKSAEIYENFGMDESMKEEAMAKMEESLDAQFNPTLMQAIQGFGITAIMYFIGAIIFALIFKRANPNPWANMLEEEKQTTV